MIEENNENLGCQIVDLIVGHWSLDESLVQDALDYLYENVEDKEVINKIIELKFFKK